VRWTGRRRKSPAIHDCFEGVDTVPLLPRINTSVLLLSGDKSPIASAQQQTFANTVPNGQVESIVGVGHGVDLLSFGTFSSSELPPYQKSSDRSGKNIEPGTNGRFQALMGGTLFQNRGAHA
jgi:hypothetical protein